jgi:hypothetical protein
MTYAMPIHRRLVEELHMTLHSLDRMNIVHSQQTLVLPFFFAVVFLVLSLLESNFQCTIL